MQNIVFVIDDLTYGGAARQLTLLAAGLVQQSFPVRVVVLGGLSPWVESLRAAGVAVEVLGWRRPFDVRPLLALRQLVRSASADVVHVWKNAALTAVLASGGCTPGRILVSAVLPPEGLPGPARRWLLRKVGGVAAFGPEEALRYRRIGMADAKMFVVSPAVEIPTRTAEPAQLPGIAPEQPVILGIGPFHTHKGFRELVWAFDILRHLRDDIHLVLVGTGPDRPRVRRFAQLIRIERWVHFLESCPDLEPLLVRARLVCVPSLRPSGKGAVLEAMAAGKPVVAGRGAGLDEVIADGETGCLADPNDKGEMARQMNRLLADEEIGRRLGAAGRQRVAAHFRPDQMVAAFAELYQRYPVRKKMDFRA